MFKVNEIFRRQSEVAAFQTARGRRPSGSWPGGYEFGNFYPGDHDRRQRHAHGQAAGKRRPGRTTRRALSFTVAAGQKFQLKIAADAALPLFSTGRWPVRSAPFFRDGIGRRGPVFRELFWSGRPVTDVLQDDLFVHSPSTSRPHRPGRIRVPQIPAAAGGPDVIVALRAANLMRAAEIPPR